MHEFSIAMSIVEAVETEAKKAKAHSVSSLTLDIGTMAGIEFYALDTALDMAIKDTILDSATITVNKITAKATCNDCSFEFDIVEVTQLCSKCQGMFHTIISGKELKIRSIVVEE